MPAGFALPDLYHLHAADMMQKFGLSAVLAQKIVAGLANAELLQRECALIEKHKVQVVTFGDANYPKLLADIYAPPSVLYFFGNIIFDEEKTMAVIGSRHAHRYAEQAIEHFVPALVHEGWTIVSGGAIGADTMAHQQTLAAGGRTIVVLGAGLLQPYPACNRNLFNKVIQKGGAVVSSFSLLTQAHPGNFPARNRIISGLSRGCVVVQAAQKSGARITAQFALEQGREVFAVPGLIGDELSAGCHALIQEGAKLINNVEDILNEFPFERIKKVMSNGDAIGKQKQKNNRLDEQAVSQKAEIIFLNQGKNTIKNDQKATIIESSFSKKEEHILQVCKKPISIDDLAFALQLDMGVLQEHLFDLQLSGRLKQNFAGLWESC